MEAIILILFLVLVAMAAMSIIMDCQHERIKALESTVEKMKEYIETLAVLRDPSEDGEEWKQL